MYDDLTWEQIARQYLARHATPSEAFRASRVDRYSVDRDTPAARQRLAQRGLEGVDPQQLADAEHYLYQRQFSGQGLPQAVAGLGMPLAYHAAKRLGLLHGSSTPDWTQLKAGTRGAMHGFFDWATR